MKNKLLSFLIFFTLSCNIVVADNLKFNTENLEIFNDQKRIKAGKGKVFLTDGSIEINANRFDYQKDQQLLKANGNGKALINSKNILIKFDELILDKNKDTIEVSGDAEVLDTIRNVSISSENFLYEIKKNLIFSDKESYLKDNNMNVINVKKFNFDLNKNIIKLFDVKAKDNNDNIIRTELAFINTDSGKIFGKDINIDFNNLSFNEDNEPRLKANSVSIDKNIVELTKGVFTTCKKRDGCPPWEIAAQKIQHDKSKKRISYKNAFLKVYDIPVMYFPSFFHPDPTVSRQSGFLTPSVKNSNKSGDFLNLPYYLVLSQNKDITFSPRFYTDENFLLQTEYRQANKKSNHIADISYFLEKDKSNKNHFFYNFFKEFNNENFERELSFKLEQTSSDTYLKTNKLKSKIIKDENILENSIDLNLMSENLSLNLNASIFENLNEIESDRYEYTFPKVELIKRLDNKTNLDGNFTFKSQASINNYDTNILEKKNINDLIFRSFPSVTSNGFYNEYSFLVKNHNSDNKNSIYKNNKNFYVSSIFQYNSSLPLIKEDPNTRSILKPKISFKVAPTHSENNRDNDTKINFSNIYTIDRMSDRTLEGGISMTYGADYSLFKKKESNEILSLKLANNIRLKENEDLPRINQINEEVSNIFSEIIYKPNKYITSSYLNALNNNLKDTTYENFTTEFKINKFLTTFDYLNENYANSNNSYLTNKTSYSIDKNNSFSYSIRENKTNDLTEYYKFMYQYKNDCLSASIEFNKDYYDDRELKPNKSLLFRLNIIPFGETSSLNLLEND